MSPAERSNRKRILRFLNAAPRTWEEIVAATSGVGHPAEAGLSWEQAGAVLDAQAALWAMLREGELIREPAELPEHDLYRPARARRVA